MNKVFYNMIKEYLIIYIDDITMYTDTFKKRIVILQEILKRLKNHGLFIKPKKYTFAAPEIKLLRHIIGRKGLKPDLSKVKAVTKFLDLTNRSELKAFLGLVNYYRVYILKCSVIAAELNYLF